MRNHENYECNSGRSDISRGLATLPEVFFCLCNGNDVTVTRHSNRATYAPTLGPLHRRLLPATEGSDTCLIMCMTMTLFILNIFSANNFFIS
jgi:hypothetical protein